MDKKELIEKLYALDSYEACKHLADEIFENFTTLGQGKESEVLEQIYSCRLEPDKVICIIEAWKVKQKVGAYDR